jgi:hypothetical protein
MVARLDSANNQLLSASYAATSLEIALYGFYAQLDDNQKARFDSEVPIGNQNSSYSAARRQHISNARSSQFHRCVYGKPYPR